MRLFLFIIFLFSLVSCKSKKNVVNSNQISEKQVFILDKCDESTQCSLEIISNANLLIKQDERQNSYIEIEKGDRIIIKYEFKRNEPPNTADAHYSELLYFEIDKSNKQLFLTNEALQNVKMVYGRFCYCKDGTSGYFKVTRGKLKLIKNDQELSIDLNFKVGKIPQLLTTIKETVNLK
ncbi:hypothetical protein UMM65_10805 [Aureibaculum sp. 2210JD6-5]|uniref:hypothetical protein n=1 Tax=Aureibaculum sp. 2210JD6-5 TaxID=3103957 RepID=UPI002AAC86CD|nr:hypothetical protein [Aureibaculum sp. 2210JD6-5]MDY7395734.1 hypothetical protein [Aureibaculum sp. 2210JD6-5]